jgi:hypothetical protein
MASVDARNAGRRKVSANVEAELHKESETEALHRVYVQTLKHVPYSTGRRMTD